MEETDGEGPEGLTSLPRRAIRRIVRDFQHDAREAKRKGSDIIPTAFILFVEKWLGFWITLIGLTFTVGSLGMGLVYAAERGRTIPLLSETIPWFLGHIWTVGLLVVLTYGILIFSLLLVSGVRLVLWIRNTYLEFWNRDTPPFTSDVTRENSQQWPPTDQNLKKARNHAGDYLGKGAILFISVFFLLFLFEQIAEETLNKLLSSPVFAVIGNSIDVGIGVLDFDGVIGAAAPNASQPQLVLFILSFVLPASIMSIGTRNLLYLVEAYVRTHIENVREGNLLSWSTVMLISAFIYSIGIFVNFLVQWS